MGTQIILGKKHRVIKNTPTPSGMLYENDVVTVTDLSGGHCESARVEDMLGRIFHINPRVLELIR
tara:strand:- start:299 stop:493 length:195 start_codon:yes stop_codon:yes gene_type:complete